MVYFVTEQEIQKKNKDMNAILAFTLFLGFLGIHRFYLERYVSGLIILMSLVLTSGQAFWVIFPLMVVEFLYFAAISERINKKKKSK